MIRRWRLKTRSGVRVRQLGDGELKSRVSELAARAGRRDVRVMISSSTRPQALNAFAMLRNSVLLTASLVHSLSKREVDAVVAHEISHFGQFRRNPWAALAIAAVLFQPPLSEVLLQAASSVLIVALVPLILYFAALRGARKREFAADAGAAALTGDPGAMISALTRISRSNKRPLACNPIVEWFSSHPSTEKRIQALASGCKVNCDDPGAP